MPAMNSSGSDGSPPPTPPPSPSPSSPPTEPELEPLAARTGKCDVCEQRNQGGMHRCRICGWQTCHSKCRSNPRCSHEYDGRKCDHYCPREFHEDQIPSRAKQVTEQKGKQGMQRNQASAASRRPRTRTSTIPVKVREIRQHRNLSSSVRKSRNEEYYLPGPSTAPILRLRHKPSPDNNTSYTSSSPGDCHARSNDVPDNHNDEGLSAARNLFVLVCKSWMDHNQEQTGDHTLDSHEYANREADRALEEYRGKNISKGKQPQRSETTGAGYIHGDDDDDGGDADGLGVQPSGLGGRYPKRKSYLGLERFKRKSISKEKRPQRKEVTENDDDRECERGEDVDDDDDADADAVKPKPNGSTDKDENSKARSGNEKRSPK